MKRFDRYEEQLKLAHENGDDDLFRSIVEEIYYDGQNSAYASAAREDGSVDDADDWRQED
jgi:hypothetical protein